MKVLLTGASGYLGQHVLESLRSRGYEVVILGRNRPAGAEDVPWLNVDLLACRDLTAVLYEARASHLLHLAWYAEYGKFWTSPLNLEWVGATMRLLRAFSELGGQHVVMAGSCAEYDWRLDAPIVEDFTPLEPVTLYGSAKDATRRLAQSWCRQQGLGFVWGHVFFPFGPGEAPQRLIPSLIRFFRERDIAPFGVNAVAQRGMLPVHDAAEAFVHLLSSGCSGRYNVCSGNAVSLGEVIRILARLCNADPAPILASVTVRPGEPQLLVGDNHRLLSVGWRPTLSLEDGLRLQVESLGSSGTGAS